MHRLLLLQRASGLLILPLLLGFLACSPGGGGGGGGGGGEAGAGSGSDPGPDPDPDPDPGPDPDPDPCAGQPDATCDSDGDGLPNAVDVCRFVPDVAQCDSDADGYGNACDCDLNQDGVCDVADAAAFGDELGLLGFGSADLDCDADTDADDQQLFDDAMAEGAPGPSGLACAGSSPCPSRGFDFPGTHWATATPAAMGLDATRLQNALDYLESVSGSDGVSEAMVVVKGLSVWEGPDVGEVHNTWSVTKSFTSTAMGLLLGEGAATYDTLGASHVASLLADYPAVTLRHLVTHGSGYDAAGGGQSSAPFVVGDPLFTPPGSQFLYWDSAINQFANVLTQIAGESLASLLDREVAQPIGMPGAEWSWGDFGFEAGLLVNGGGGNKSEGVFTNARTLARFCHLFLARGDWDGQQVVPSEWIANATRTQVPYTVPDSAGGLGPGAYGYGWFTNGEVAAGGVRLWPDAPHDAYMAAGFKQNRCWIVPSWDLFVVRTGTTGQSYDPSEENEFLRLLGLARQ